jgi:prepilin-type N-terminal cleavage/methylation domain-containing protein
MKGGSAMIHRKKGMTLIEVVTALAISGILSLLMVQIMNTVNATIRATSDLNRRLAYEGKYADNLVVAGADSKDISVSIEYDPDAAPVQLRNEEGHNQVAEYTVKVPDTFRSKLNTNYRFFVVQPFEYETAEVPSENYNIRLDIKAIGDGHFDTLDEIVISGAALDCTYTFNDIKNAFVPSSVGANNIATENKISAASLPAGKAGKTITSTGEFAILIPVKYEDTATIVADPNRGRGIVNVDLKVKHTTAHTSKNFTWCHMALDYCTGTVYELPDGVKTVQYYPQGHETDNVGAAYMVTRDASTGNAEVRTTK